MRLLGHPNCAAFGLALALAVAPGQSEARSLQDEKFPAAQTWTTAIRMLRVDLGYEITERDRDAGFAMFNYRDTNVTAPGSIEIVPTKVDGIESSRIVVSVSRMPNYVERFLLSRLARKLREEYGDPPTRAPTPPQTPPQNPPQTPTPPTDHPPDATPPREGSRPDETPAT